MNIPSELKYTKDHEWISLDGNIATVGITDFAQRELGDIVYVEVETIGEKELFKAACCNLSESFETNPSIDSRTNREPPRRRPVDPRRRYKHRRPSPPTRTNSKTVEKATRTTTKIKITGNSPGGPLAVHCNFTNTGSISGIHIRAKGELNVETSSTRSSLS